MVQTDRGMLLTYRGTVYPWHCDHVGHMNNMWYAGKFDEASWNLLLQLGITPSYLRDSYCGMAALSQETEFKRELLAGDVIEVRSQVIEIREKIIRFTHTMYNAENGEIAAICSLTGIHMDRRIRKSCPFPTSMRDRAEELSLSRMAA